MISFIGAELASKNSEPVLKVGKIWRTQNQNTAGLENSVHLLQQILGAHDVLDYLQHHNPIKALRRKIWQTVIEIDLIALKSVLSRPVYVGGAEIGKRNLYAMVTHSP
jgi:hypothetical protein